MKRSTSTALAALFLLAGGVSASLAQQGPPDKDKNKQDEHGKSAEQGKSNNGQRGSKPQSERANQQADREKAFHAQQQERSAQYRGQMDQRGQDRDQAKSQAVDWRSQNRPSRSKYQEEYVTRVHQQDVRFASHGPVDYRRYPTYYAAPRYRYSYEGRYVLVNDFGRTQLRAAVNTGYAEGYRMGQADRRDRWHSDFEDSYAYRDGTYGYAGVYLDEGVYRFYFREGFRRGYEDGLNRHYQYGYSTGNGFAVTASVMGGIFSFQAIQ